MTEERKAFIENAYQRTINVLYNLEIDDISKGLIVSEVDILYKSIFMERDNFNNLVEITNTLLGTNLKEEKEYEVE